MRHHWLLIALFSLALSAAGAVDPIAVPRSFPGSDYAPFGYLDNPFHSAVLNRSGIIRSVPPLGFGFWAVPLPWPYGDGAMRPVNYLSLLHLSVNVDGVTFHRMEDFPKNEVNLVSRYHTKTMMSYDWEFHGVSFSAKYYLSGEHSIVSILEVANRGAGQKTVTIHATNTYGYPHQRWWGADGVTSRRNTDVDAGVSKIWAYGDIFVLGADRAPAAYKATHDDAEWTRWIESNNLSGNNGATCSFPNAMHTVVSFRMTVPADGSDSMAIGLTRDVNERAAIDRHREVIASARPVLREKLSVDEEFYSTTPVLVGDWAPAWKHGWIYDIETLRMTVRPPSGIYKSPWDGMQIHTPRQVLGETMFDMMALSHADLNLAKKVILGTFANAPSPGVPCSREDGSVNMICADGSEGTTNPTWGYPFLTIRSIWLRDGDDYWIKSLYPYLKAYVDWWMKNRTDKDGWFVVKCSWEAQDASARFPLERGAHAGAVADFVRMVDIEAAMAHAFKTLETFAEAAGHPEDIPMWKKLGDRRLETTRSMYVDGWFRDWDSRSNKPVILKDYWDIMMLAPLTVNIATPEQIEGVKPRFDYYRQNPLFWLEWPSFMFHFTEAAWNAGLREFDAGIVVDTGDRIYPRIDGRTLQSLGGVKTNLPPQYAFRIPGVTDEFWPINEDNPGGCENYGWGATLPGLVIRNVIGFRESPGPARNEFVLAPAIPDRMAQPGRKYGITNLRFRGLRTDAMYEVASPKELRVKLTMTSNRFQSMKVLDDSRKILVSAAISGAPEIVSFLARNFAPYTIVLE